MGGNAIPNARRVKKEEYFELWQEVKEKLEKTPKELRVSLVKAYNKKSDFGDMDIIVETDPLMDWNKHVEVMFEPKHTYNNDKFFSFEYKGIQVDLIKASPENFDVHNFFYSYNDMGLLLGKMCYAIGCTLGFDGLRKKIYSEDGSIKLGEFNFSKDYVFILEFLGLNVDRYERGFDTLEDMFDYVSTCRFFNKKMFDPVLWNNNQRTRDLKRSTLIKFMDVMDKYQDRYVLWTKNLFLEEMRVFDISKYAEYKMYLHALTLKHEYTKEAAMILNGGLLMSKYGWKGRQIGEAMKMFNGLFDSPEQRTFHILEQEEKVFEFFDCLNLDGVTP